MLLANLAAGVVECLPLGTDACGAQGCCAAAPMPEPDGCADGEEDPCEGPCSPFMACSTCAGVPVTQAVFLLPPAVMEFPLGAEPLLALPGRTRSTVWQPPRA
ncbi:MAG: hypothetical protein JNL52_04775 [Flavobacteriales bacterium]|nr:hypothetical protein [Flavobacteriales bacterium]